MDNSSCFGHVTFSRAAEYRICVEGKLNQYFSERLAGMSICPIVRENGSFLTILTGRLCDQAELMGVLNSLYDLHMAIISVQVIGKSGLK
jgi:hypothetical protein